MLCITVLIVLTLTVRLILICARLDGKLGPPVIVYPRMTALFAGVIWLVFFDYCAEARRPLHQSGSPRRRLFIERRVVDQLSCGSLSRIDLGRDQLDVMARPFDILECPLARIQNLALLNRSEISRGGALAALESRFLRTGGDLDVCLPEGLRTEWTRPNPA